ncbi:MAG TPA: zinc-dependent metalloprotease family protein [Thermoanaerobaculia bacterium]|nr:zinc-dependent metalloprotease family protein [Thermoanaerobaculia bacterium]
MWRRWLRFTLLAAAAMAVVATLGNGPASAQGSSSAGTWTRLTAEELERRQAPGSRPWIRPQRFAAFALDAARLERSLASAPDERDGSRAPVWLSLPRPDGTLERFEVVASPVMAPELAARMAALGWPMQTYLARGIDRPSARGRFDWGGPDGFHAMIESPEGTYFIDPYWKGDRALYISYLRADLTREAPFECEVHGEAPPQGVSLRGDTSGALRRYRLAVAATGEYTQDQGGTVAAAQAAVVTTINRVNQVYERDFSVRLELVADNMDLIYTDGTSDPYTNGNCPAMWSQNQVNVDTVIGNANYDIGHVFGLGGAGKGKLRSVCDSAVKAQGCTHGNPPQGDAFDIDYVAHEMGHQFGGHHSFNGEAGNCLNAWTTGASYEPGSGSTIMSYAGICLTDNLQGNSDAYFHRRSLDQILSFVAGAGNCFTSDPGVNPSAPTVDAGSSYTIPVGTPFELEAQNGTDSDGDPLTFTWEQFDLGTQEPLATGDDGVQPIFRSFDPTSNPVRVFPKLPALLSGSSSVGETLPVTDRTLTFQVTVRDNHAGGGRESKDSTTITSTTSSGPFEVNAPNGGETLVDQATVSWDVASTTAAPVGAAAVDISLSIDGGMTYPFRLASGTPNDGSETVNLPAVATTTARVKVKGAGNVFFDISNANFTVSPAAPGGHLLILLDRTGSMSATRPSTGNTRCEDALVLAQQDVADFVATRPAGSWVAVWTFADDAPSDLTGGFVDPSLAAAALAALSPTGCSGLTPLAEALCAAGDQFVGLGAGVSDRQLAVSSDGEENNSSGPCAGPWSGGGPPWDPGSWQDRVETRLTGLAVVQARYWGSVTESTFDRELGVPRTEGAVSDAAFFEHLALVTGGTFQNVGDGDPLPPSFFGSPGSATPEIPTLGVWGLAALVVALLGAGLVLMRRRA